MVKKEGKRTVTPIVDKIQHKLDAVFLSGVDCIVQSLETLRAVVDIAAGGVEDLKVDLVRIRVCGRRRRVDVAEAPDAQDLVLSLLREPALEFKDELARENFFLGIQG